MEPRALYKGHLMYMVTGVACVYICVWACVYFCMKGTKGAGISSCKVKYEKQ